MNTNRFNLAALAVALTALVVAGPVAATPATFDTSGILADMGVYAAGAMVLLTAFIGFLWAKRSIKLAKPG